MEVKENEIRYNGENGEKILNLSNFHCIVFHLGMLDMENWKKIYSINFSVPYIRIVSGRARPLEKEILDRCLWARSRIIDRSIFLRALEGNDIFGMKYKIVKEVLV